MNKHNLEIDIKQSLTNLLILVRKNCYNKISSNISYIISDIYDFEDCNSKERKRFKKEINDKKKTMRLEQLTDFLQNQFDDFYDINFYVFKAQKDETIIEVQYLRKSNLDPEFFETVKANKPMFHSKVSMPIYKNYFGRFDVNWESGGLTHRFKEIIYNLMK